MSAVSKEDPEYPGVGQRSFQTKSYGEGDIRVVQKKASREEHGNRSGIRYGSLRITSHVPPSSGILRSSDQK